jgi:hypothetical protein
MYEPRDIPRWEKTSRYLYTQVYVRMIYVYTVHHGVTSKGTILLLRVVESAVKNIGPMSILISEMAKTRLHAQIVLGNHRVHHSSCKAKVLAEEKQSKQEMTP